MQARTDGPAPRPASVPQRMVDWLEGTQGFSFGEAIYPRNGIYGPVTRKYLVMIFACRGSARVTCDGTEVVLAENSCGCFRNESTLYFEYDGPQGAHAGWCEAALEPGRQLMDLAVNGCFPSMTISPRIGALHKMGLELGSGSGSSLNRLRNAMGEALFLAYFQESQSSEQERSVPLSVRRAQLYLDENWAKEVSNNSLARLVGVSPQHLVTSFRRHIGMTPVRYLWKLRSEEGRRLLLNTDMLISEIAWLCGYKNPFHFSRHISDSFGASPRDLRLREGYPHASNQIEGMVNTGYSEMKGWMARP